MKEKFYCAFELDARIIGTVDQPYAEEHYRKGALADMGRMIVEKSNLREERRYKYVCTTTGRVLWTDEIFDSKSLRLDSMLVTYSTIVDFL